MILRSLCTFIALLFASTNLLAQRTGSQRTAWNKPFPPFQIIGDIYYVGASGVSSFLITTPDGHILLDGGLPETASQIKKNIAALGFHISDVKYLLNSHAHFDHAGGLAALKRASHARMAASRGDASTLASGHQLSYSPGQSDTRFPPVAVDRIVEDGGMVSLGGVTITAYLTPGHTKGCTTWSMPVATGGRTYQAVFYCSTTVAGNQLVNNTKYPAIGDDYEKTFAKLRKLPCDVFLGPHPEFFRLSEKRKQLLHGGPNPFIDPREMAVFVDESERDFQTELQRQKRSVRTGLAEIPRMPSDPRFP